MLVQWKTNSFVTKLRWNIQILLLVFGVCICFESFVLRLLCCSSASFVLAMDISRFYILLSQIYGNVFVVRDICGAGGLSLNIFHRPKETLHLNCTRMKCEFSKCQCVFYHVNSIRVVRISQTTKYKTTKVHDNFIFDSSICDKVYILGVIYFKFNVITIRTYFSNKVHAIIIL